LGAPEDLFSKLLTNHNGALPDLNFDWSNIQEAGAMALSKTLPGLGFRTKFELQLEQR
jgi:hypothetical protein